MRHLAILVLAACAGAGAVEPVNLLANGDMEQGAVDGPVRNWGGRWLSEPEHRFLRLAAAPGGTTTALRAVPVGDARAVRFACRARVAGIGAGVAEVRLEFIGTDGAIVRPGPAAARIAGTSALWQPTALRSVVPRGATAVRIRASLRAEAGSLDIDDLSLAAMDPADIPLDERTSGDVLVDAGQGMPSALHVDGRRILDESGAEVRLQGVSVPSLEWNPAGEAILPAVVTAIESWRANVIRLPVQTDFWFGRGTGQTDGGAAYRALVDQAVLAAASRTAWLILDLHRFRAPTDADVAFWRDAAVRFKDHPAVIFGLFNEPHDLTWPVWKDGGMVDEARKPGEALAENADRPAAFRTPGMQALVDAVRAAGARNLLLVGGLDWAYDLSGVLNGYTLDDRGGRGIVWDTHVYPWKRGWQAAFLDVAARMPVLVGEVGCDARRYDFVPPERFEDPYTWAPDMLACIARNRLHWTAWAFHPRCGPPMVQDQAGFRPTPFWGAFAKAALRGATFASDRLR